MREKYKKEMLYFASDFHLGLHNQDVNTQEQKILNFLEHARKNNAEKIFLVGDVFDFWFEYKRVVPKGYFRLFSKLYDLHCDGIKVYMFKGNHDMWMLDYFEKECGVEIISDELIFEHNNKKFFVHHGDGLGPGDRSYKFLKKVFREASSSEKHSTSEEQNPETLRLLHETILKVTESIENLRFNVAISQMMILANHLQKTDTFSDGTIKILLQLLAPLAPHLSEELWQKLGGNESIVNQPWPVARKELLVSDEITIVFQVNGKLRGEANFSKDASKEEIIATAKEHEKVLAFTTGKEIVKEIYVPGKLVNLAVKG